MSVQRVAGTIMLNGANGDKRFLVKHSEETGYNFLATNVTEEQTSLGKILDAIKLDVLDNVRDIRLVELTNVSYNNQNIPLFVFEMEEEQLAQQLPENFYWETPATLRDILGGVKIMGVPLLK